MTTTPEQQDGWLAKTMAARQRLLARIGRAHRQGRGVRLSAEEARIFTVHVLPEEINEAMEADR